MESLQHGIVTAFVVKGAHSQTSVASIIWIAKSSHAERIHSLATKAVYPLTLDHLAM